VGSLESGSGERSPTLEDDAITGSTQLDELKRNNWRERGWSTVEKLEKYLCRPEV
jgi:hypothetical protein